MEKQICKMLKNIREMNLKHNIYYKEYMLEFIFRVLMRT